MLLLTTLARCVKQACMMESARVVSWVSKLYTVSVEFMLSKDDSLIWFIMGDCN